NARVIAAGPAAVARVADDMTPRGLALQLCQLVLRGSVVHYHGRTGVRHLLKRPQAELGARPTVVVHDDNPAVLAHARPAPSPNPDLTGVRPGILRSRIAQRVSSGSIAR